MDLLHDALIYLVAALIAVPVTRLLGFGSVPGYLAAGIAIGPAGLAFVSDPESILHFAELGVVFLLFVIGLELQPSRLWVLRKMVFGLGTAQVLLTAAALSVIAILFGVDTRAAMTIGLILSLSSTAFVLQMLAERGQLTTTYGRASFTILLLQDLAVIPLIALLPMLGNAGDMNMSLQAIAVPALTIAGLIVGGRYLLRPVLRIAARTRLPEIFTAVALLVVISAALLMEFAGLSMALGAFIAGMLLADSEYRHELEADIAPFKGLLLGLFFIAVGMTVDLGLLVREPGSVLAIVGLLMAVKAAVVYPLARVFGICDRRNAITLAVVLAQGGEFAFVLFGIVARGDVLDPALIDRLTLAVAVSMLMTPLSFVAWERFSRALAKPEPPVFDDIDDGHHPVIIAGFGRVGQIAGRLLGIAGQRFTALEIDSSQVDVVRRYGHKVYFGDASKLDLLRAAGADKAKLLVLAIDDIEASMRTAETVRKNFPNLQIIARARNRRHQYHLMDLGIENIFRETLYSSLAIGEKTLVALGMEEARAADAVSNFRAHDEQLIRQQHAVHHDEEELIQTTRDTARELEQLLRNDRSQS